MYGGPDFEHPRCLDCAHCVNVVEEEMLLCSAFSNDIPYPCCHWLRLNGNCIPEINFEVRGENKIDRRAKST